MAVVVNSSGTINSGIVSISYPDSLKIHVLSFFWGLWNLVKKLMRSALYNPDAQLKRDSPPTCLVDTSLGQHSYVKLKVRIACTVMLFNF